MNPETSLTWHPLQSRLKDLRMSCLADERVPPYWRRVEDRAQEGTADLWWGWVGGAGWIELKHRHGIPVGDDTPCVIESITPHQRLFWRQVAECGGNIHVLTRVGMEWFLHDGEWARLNLGDVPVSVLRDSNLLPDSDHLPPAAVILRICGRMPS